MEAFDVVDECLECRTWLSKVSVLGSSGRGRWRYDWRNPSRNALLGCGTRWAGRGVGGSSGWLLENTIGCSTLPASWDYLTSRSEKPCRVQSCQTDPTSTECCPLFLRCYVDAQHLHCPVGASRASRGCRRNAIVVSRNQMELFEVIPCAVVETERRVWRVLWVRQKIVIVCSLLRPVEEAITQETARGQS